MVSLAGRDLVFDSSVIIAVRQARPEAAAAVQYYCRRMAYWVVGPRQISHQRLAARPKHRHQFGPVIRHVDHISRELGKFLRVELPTGAKHGC